MIIKSITLQNFRQFIGKQTVEFSCDPEKKATIIIAKNGTGKTTLLEAFSWIFYDKCSLKTIVNSKMKEEAEPYSDIVIEGSVVLEHYGKEYTISRHVLYSKQNTTGRLNTSIFSITYKSGDGTSKILNGIEAKTLMEEIVPEQLFQYFFFKGESIEKIGKDISSGKNSKNSEFVKAIKGMLGFDYLYAEKSHLESILKLYRSDISKNNSDKKLQDIQKRINDADSEIAWCDEQIEKLENEISGFKSEKEVISDEILRSGNVAEKQKESIALKAKLNGKISKRNDLRKKLFQSFSSQSWTYFARDIIESAIEDLKNNGDIDKGIPGLNASAVKYLLSKGKCICGCELHEGDEHYLAMNDLIRYLPPFNLGAEISKFSSLSRLYHQKGDSFMESFSYDRKDLQALDNEISALTNDIEVIDALIKNYPDMSKKKDRERELENLINTSNTNKGRMEYRKTMAQNSKDAALKEKSNYAVTDEQARKLSECEFQTEWLLRRLNNYLFRNEKEKRDELQKSINEIFRDIFDVDIELQLNDDYGIKLRSGANTSLDDFENSTSQDAIMAFSFIGGIIRLARNKTVKNNATGQDEMDGVELNTEPYPLVMDAPSSSFDIDRIANFCKIMPSIAEQVIFFIKDTDGIHVKRDLANIIGKEYTMAKPNNTQTIFVED